jgi:hexokinase
MSSIGNNLEVPLSKLALIVENFQKELHAGLSMDGSSMIKALPTYINKLATGRERGEFLVIDLGGSNLRVGCVKLDGDGKVRLDRMKWPLQRQEKGSSLFDFIVKCVRTYLEECKHESLKGALNGERRDLGFTFSYPVRQEGLAHGILIQWNKAMACNDVIGLDVVRMLHDALERDNLQNIVVKALLNDTVGTLVAHAYVDCDTRIGVILGTGTNAAYLESARSITKLGSLASDTGEMVINTEWGAFGDGKPEYLPLTDVDLRIDRETVNPGRQLFEKMISGMYLGEIARLYLKERFGGLINDTPFSLDTADLSEIEELEELEGCKGILKSKLGWSNPSDEETRFARDIFQSVVKRSARLCAAGIVSLYRSIGSPKQRVVVAFDGSLYQHYPNYPKHLKDAIGELQPGHTMDLQLAKDASMVGAAAVLAAM